MIYLSKSKLYKHVIDKKNEILLVDYFPAKRGHLEIPIFIIQDSIGHLHWCHEIRKCIIFYNFENYILGYDDVGDGCWRHNVGDNFKMV